MEQSLAGIDMLNKNKIEEKRTQRKNKIATYAQANKVPEFAAAMYIDQNAPYTTNKSMLAEVGYNVNKITADNCYEVIDNLKEIGVIVIHAGSSPERVARILDDIINEEIPECWGGPDMQEYVDITPDQV